MPYLFALTLVLAPTYAIRFGFFGLPTNMLMVWIFLVWVVFAVWIVCRHRVSNFFNWLYSEVPTSYFLLPTFFLIAGVASLFVGGFSEEKLGQFVVLFLQPIGTFFIGRYVFIHDSRLQTGNWLVRAALFFVGLSGLYAILQYFTLIGVPVAWWGNAQEPKRAVAFFLHPNFYALFVTQLLAFLVPIIALRLQGRGESIKQKPSVISLYPLPSTLYPLVAWSLGAIGLLLSLSRGGWLGLIAAIGVYVLIVGNRAHLKRAAVLFAIALIVVLAIPNFRYRVLLPFRGEKSSVARFSLWNTGWKMVKDDPISGKGLLGFSNNWYAYNTDPGLEHYPAPHNIVLNFWVDTGIFGLISFFGLVVLAVVRGIKERSNAYKLGLLLAGVALVVHGLVDIPYFKNDLALVFWLLYSFI